MPTFANAKDRLNKFAAGLKRAGGEKNDKWTNDLSKRPRTDPERQQFVTEIAAGITFDSFAAVELKKTTSARVEKVGGKEGGWISYDAFVNNQGKLVADERIRLRTVISCIDVSGKCFIFEIG